ncbi:LysR family transcriptional regulator [Pseudonocardia sp.]|uniref:LysR family transcriptional regulator n=1 Tax=Pseudonocardia sp. TaxID=60912 RepID=UPI003D1489B7
MEIRQLRYFVAVAEELHFGRAAQRLHIAQPAVSQQVARLERKLGFALFDRNPRRVRLTEAGQRMLTEARAVLAAAEQAAAVAAHLARSPAATLRLGTSPGLGSRIAPAMDRLAAGGITVELDARPVAQQLAALRSGELDAALVRTAARPRLATPARPGVRVVPLWSEPLRAALPASHPLAERDRVGLADLAALPARIPDAACDPLVRSVVLEAFRAAGLSPQLGRPSTTAEDTLIEIGRVGSGWTPVWTPPCAHHRVAVVDVVPRLSTWGALLVSADRPPAAHVVAAFGPAGN